jgi:large subunit ribosomal protein L35
MGKYKMKTHSGAKARVKITGTGKFMHRRIGINNFRRKKRGETLREMSGRVEASHHFTRRLRRLMPYGGK